MKDLKLLVWLTQLGLSVVIPLGCFILLAAWLHGTYGWGVWIYAVCSVVGMIFAIDGFRASLKIMREMSKDKKKADPPVAFNDHE